jgi:outer membrane PBP1 activator LpoA protein
MNGQLKSIRLAIVTLLILLFFGCTQAPEIKPRPVGPTPAQKQALDLAVGLVAAGDFSAAAQSFEQLAAEIPGMRDELLLRAADARIDGGEPRLALNLLQRIDRAGLGKLQNQAALLARARALLDLEQAAEALALLGPEPPAQTTMELLSRHLSIQADALAKLGKHLDSARVMSELDLMLDDPGQRLDNQQRLLRTLGTFSDAELSRPLPGEPLLAGWLDLARATRAYESRPEQADMELSAWRERHPTHPALPQLLARYRGLADRDLAELGRIAVLLPSSGRYAQAAAAIRDGLLSAYYRTQPSRRPQLLFYDTSNQADLWPLLQQALADGAAAAIGPLQKPAVEQLTRAGDLGIPVLALNRVELDIPPPAGLYQFGLNPEDEAAQAAEKAWADGAVTAAALVPEGDWGQRLGDGFQRRFEELGGRLLERQSYDANQHDFSKPVTALLNLDDSEARHAALVRLLGQKLEFEPQRRRDAGALFLAANADKARQLWPQLQFHRIGDLPVYTTSHIHGRHFTPPQDLDLVGLTFPEIPWLLAPRAPGEAEGPDGSLGRLYAMGMDSYRLLAALPRLEEFPDGHLNGATGQLSLDTLRQVHRRLPWARMGKQGPKELGYLPDPEVASAPADAPDTERPLLPVPPTDAAAR